MDFIHVYSDFHDNYRCRLDVSRIVDKDAAQMRQGGVMARCEAYNASDIRIIPNEVEKMRKILYIGRNMAISSLSAFH